MVQDVDPYSVVLRNKTSTQSRSRSSTIRFNTRKRDHREEIRDDDDDDDDIIDNTIDTTTTTTTTTTIDNNTTSDKITPEKSHADNALINPFEEQPGCSLLTQLSKDSTIPQTNLSMIGILETYGKYVPVNHSSSFGKPRYDHRTCFLMKPRYNCARNFQNTTHANDMAVASDFALILEAPPPTQSTNPIKNNNHRKYSSSSCNLQKFAEDAGGPAGVARRMLQNFQKDATPQDSAEKASVDNSTNDLIEVLLVGTSRFRQIFEALVCGFSEQMNDLKVQVGGPRYSKRHKFMDADEIGSLVDLKFVRGGGCYKPEAQANYSHFFRDDGTIVPINNEGCNHDIGSVEFSDDTIHSNSRIRFYYVFRPWAWTNFTPALEALDIDKNHKMDFVLWENSEPSNFPSWQYAAWSDLGSLYKHIFDIRSTSATANIENHDAHTLYTKMQMRDIGRYFGADNPWITNAPDEHHGCMPGMPDDQVNFLLWYMLSLSTMEQEGSPNNNK